MAAYRALYRKWRPMRFEDLVGQRHVSDTLRGAVVSGRIAHAYLFCGTRGTGKTSAAKIFSRAVNCQSPENGEPCNKCETCKGILNGTILDVYEMDAASNRGVESIREIREEVIYAPVGCKYKVYIIDEVHMLTTEAFNALLKTLEEPPEHTIFILATTDPNKLPQTVLSRCQRFDFRRIGADDIVRRISRIAEAEGIDITPDAAELVAELGDGSMRDAISTLDRCAAFGGEKLTTERVGEITGIIGSKRLFDIADAVVKDSAKDALAVSGEVLNAGKEAQFLLENLIEHFRALLICKTTDKPAAMLEKTEQAAERYSKQAEKYSSERILYSIKALSDCLAQAKWLSKPRIAVETAMVKLCSPSYSSDTDALLARIEKLETAVANLSSGAYVTAPPTADTDSAQPQKGDGGGSVKSDAENRKEDTEASGGQTAEECVFWADALNEIKKESKALYAFLYNADVCIKGEIVEIQVAGKVAYNKIATPNGIDYLSKLLSRVSGSTFRAKVLIKGEGGADEKDKAEPSINDLAAKAAMFGDRIDIV